MHWDRPTENNLSNKIILCGQRIERKILKNLAEEKNINMYMGIWREENEKKYTCINPKTKVSIIERFRLVLSG